MPPEVRDHADKVNSQEEEKAPVVTELECGSATTSTTEEAPRVRKPFYPQLPRYQHYPNATTRLFEYCLSSWDGKRGEHCTYKYQVTPSTGEISASVTVRLPGREPLHFKDERFHYSRTHAQNQVAQMALERLFADQQPNETNSNTPSVSEHEGEVMYHPGYMPYLPFEMMYPVDPYYSYYSYYPYEAYHDGGYY